MKTRRICEPARRIPVFGDHDVVVVGGGMAGAAAALASARNGARVALVEKENGLGGLATSGLVIFYLPLCDGMGRQVIGGLGEELLGLSLKYGPDKVPECWRGRASAAARTKHRYQAKFNPASFMIAMEQAVLAARVTILYDTRFCAVHVEGRTVKAVIVENKSGRGALTCRAVVDASGDADVCHAAGEKTVSLSTNRKSGWALTWQKDHLQWCMPGDPYWEALPAGTRSYAGDRWQDVSAMNVEGRKLVLKEVNKARGRRSFHDYYPVLLSAIPQYRMTRRLVGSVEIHEEDDKKWVDDAVGMTGDWRKAGPILYIPYRSLTGKRIGNIISAGRCISATGGAWDITRAIPTCAVTGEAAGTAAAMAARRKTAFVEVPIRSLQQRLRQQGVIIDKRLSR